MDKEIFFTKIAQSQDGNVQAKIRDEDTDDALTLYLGNSIRQADTPDDILRDMNYAIAQLQSARIAAQLLVGDKNGAPIPAQAQVILFPDRSATL